MVELEKTYLAKYLPADLKKYPKKEIVDIYFPYASSHPIIRLRKRGLNFRLTKKAPIDKNDSSRQFENTIELSKQEYNSFKQIIGKKIEKTRYYYKYKSRTAEIDVFKKDLKGLVVVDFEFANRSEMKNFKMPTFCLVEVTQQNFIAAGKLAGRKYSQIRKFLDKLNYKKINAKR